MISEHEKRKYEGLFENFPNYNTDRSCLIFSELLCTERKGVIKPNDGLIDFGCGRGYTAHFFLERGLSVTLIDIASNALAPEAHLLCALGNCRFIEACLWELPETTPPVEWGICTDVLEHIPEEKVEKVIAGIAQHVTKGALLNIALGTDVWGEGIGQDLHLTVKPREWWREKLDPYFEQEEHFKKADAFHTVLVTPKNALKEK